jgi:hypothetical protein
MNMDSAQQSLKGFIDRMTESAKRATGAPSRSEEQQNLIFGATYPPITEAHPNINTKRGSGLQVQDEEDRKMPPSWAMKGTQPYASTYLRTGSFTETEEAPTQPNFTPAQATMPTGMGSPFVTPTMTNMLPNFALPGQTYQQPMMEPTIPTMKKQAPPSQERKGPRVGGISGGIAWTGGSNLPSKQLAIPTSVNQFRPSDYKNGKTAAQTAQQGLCDEMKLSDGSEKGTILFTTWINEISAHMKEYGMDTVFRVTNFDENLEWNMLDSWGICEYRTQVLNWVNSLHEGVYVNGTRQPVCPYDIQNLQWSGKMILNSITKTFRSLLVSDLGPTPDGPIILCKIVNKVQMMSTNAMRDLETRLRSLNLKSETGEDVESFCVKVKEIADRLDQGISYKPTDLSVLVAQKFVYSTVETFRIQAIQIYTRVQQDPKSMHYSTILTMLRESYVQLKGMKMWPPLMAQRKFQANSLRPTGSGRGNGRGNNSGRGVNNQGQGRGWSRSSSSRVTFGGRCFDCGQQGHRKGDPSCQARAGQTLGQGTNQGRIQGRGQGNCSAPRGGRGQRSPPADAPKQGESEHRVINGEEQRYCSKCKRWTKGSFLHNTSQHRPNPNRQQVNVLQPNQPANNQVQQQVASPLQPTQQWQKDQETNKKVQWDESTTYKMNLNNHYQPSSRLNFCMSNNTLQDAFIDPDEAEARFQELCLTNRSTQNLEYLEPKYNSISDIEEEVKKSKQQDQELNF